MAQSAADHPTGHACEVMMLAETLPCVDHAIKPGVEVECRAEVRYLCDRQAICYELPAQQRLWARIRNISTEGVSLLLRAPIAAGTHLILELKTLDPAATLTLVAQAMHSTRQQDQTWIVGCKLLSRPREDDLMALL
jgi:hypothetical protein